VDSGRFWRELCHPDHIVQLYESPDQLVNSLVEFAVAGFRAGESVVVIATSDRIRQLDERLRDIGFQPFALELRDQYITLDADQALYEFVFKGSPDKILFRLLASNLMKRAKRSGRKVRAFGEMVSILWAQGNPDGALCLESLWSEYISSERFSLFCAYPNSVFEDLKASVTEVHVCQAHSSQIASVDTPGMLQVKRTPRQQEPAA
jgi:hypothetical protein